MKKIASALVLALALLARARASELEASVVGLYAGMESGGKQFICTATAFDKKGGKTLFLTAAHCLAKPGVMWTYLFTSTDTLTYEPARVLKVGNMKLGYDFAILAGDKPYPVTPLGNEMKEAPNVSVLAIGMPGGLGKLPLRGYVLLRNVDRPMLADEGTTNWSGCMLVELHGGPGSSGSAVVSDTTHTIIGMLVGFSGTYVVALPVSRVTGCPSTMVVYEEQP